MEQRADLHIHTIASDGRLTPSEVVKAAKQVELAAISITDHDTVDGIDEAINRGKELGVEVVPGIEISTVSLDNAEVHLLGYFFNHRDNDLLAQLQILKNARWERGRQMVEKLNSVGVPVTFEQVIEFARGGAIGRPHVARAICEVKAAASMDSAFGRFLQPSGPGYVPRYKITPHEAVKLILQAGGVVSCAHVAKLKKDELVVDLIKNGLQAIEVYHPDHGSASSRFYMRFAQRRGLIATGGSDAHCFDVMRCGVGQVTVPYEVVEQLRQAAKGNTINKAD